MVSPVNNRIATNYHYTNSSSSFLYLNRFITKVSAGATPLRMVIRSTKIIVGRDNSCNGVVTRNGNSKGCNDSEYDVFHFNNPGCNN